MADWTPESVAALAPDAASASAGQALASIKKWKSVGASARAVWGLCQGSGKDPYQTRIDLNGPAFKCSCPSRKFPCKHGIGLLLIYAKDRASFTSKDEPAWVTDWIGGRTEKAEKKAEKAKVEAEKPVDVEAQARRAAKRDERVRAGVAECASWLEDLVRHGLASAQRDKASEWDRITARMVDAQAPGLATFVRRVEAAMASGEGWEVRTLDRIGNLHLLLEAARKLDALPPELAGDVRTALGYTQSKEDVLSAPGVTDHWGVIGLMYEEEERLTTRRTWLVGRDSGRYALVLDFSAGGQRFDASFVPGTQFEGEIGFYPSAHPVRALLKRRGESSRINEAALAALAGGAEANLEGYAAALAQNPWLVRWPMVLGDARLVRAGAAWVISDAEGRSVPLRAGFAGGMQLWRLLSASGGRGRTVVGEWDGMSLLPLGAFGSGAFLDLAPRWAA